MTDKKEIITRVTFLNHSNEHEVIFDTYDSYDLKDHIEFPEVTTLHVGNKIIIEEITYLIEEISVDVLRPESKRVQNNLQVIVYISKID